MKILGLMSGTSMDGVDCCYADISLNRDYDFNYKILDAFTYSFPLKIKKNINASIGNTQTNIVKKTNEQIGVFFCEKSIDFLGNRQIDLISIHGQTISHIDKVRTIQIGNPEYLSKYFKIPVCYDFRSLDVLLGGTGAPLMPFLDWLIFKDSSDHVITLNIGGIANITSIPKRCKRTSVIGFDTGPGMCLIDQYVKLKFDLYYDDCGVKASRGSICYDLLEYLMQDPFINKSYPKSTSREKYDMNYLLRIVKKFQNINQFDFLRTLVFFTASSISINIKKIVGSKLSYKLILSGGGSRNLLLVQDIKKNTPNSNLEIIDSYNINRDIKEALLMAVMGVAKYKNINNNMPSVTGAIKLDCYGEIYE